jgi:hypothetical protein
MLCGRISLDLGWVYILAGNSCDKFESFEPALPSAIRLCDNREGFVALPCRNLEAFLSSSL